MAEELSQSDTGNGSTITLIDTNVDASGKEDLASFSKKFKVKSLMNAGPNVTHCITGTVVHGGEHFATMRTVKFLMAFAEQIQLVSSEWITACLCAGRIIDVDEYAVKGIVVSNNIVRFKEYETNGTLFENLRFSVEAKDNGSITHRKIVKLIEHCGGRVTEPGADVIAISMTELPIDCDYTTVTYRYVLDSLTFQTQLKLDKYMIK